MKYNFNAIEAKWQKHWADHETFRAKTRMQRPKYYVLDMFPYPSGMGLHVGHPLGYIASDIIARYKRHKGYNVLHPMGYDSFGLPAEQHAIDTGQNPAVTTKNNIAQYRKQLDKLGFSFDWRREVKTSDPSYYKWTQWIFCQLFDHYYCTKSNCAKPIAELISLFEKEGNEHCYASTQDNTSIFSASDWNNFTFYEKQKLLLNYRLTYLAEATVNWCPDLGTVLANDEVINGVSERGSYPIIQKKMTQWMMRISAYADRLLKGLEIIDWPESIKEIQKHWIGKSKGVQLKFHIEGFSQTIYVFTTRPDTIFGTTFITLAPEHELVSLIASQEQKKQVEAYVLSSSKKSEISRITDVKTITGIWTGAYAIHPITGNKIPIWISDYVLASYGTGAIMSVPSGDQRDYKFAKRFDLPIVNIFKDIDISEGAFMGKQDIRLINSDFLNGLNYETATKYIIEYVEMSGLGKEIINYRLRDAVFSRQRYWGEPIPIYYKNGIPHRIEDQCLPIVLPKIDEYLPTKQGDPPLGRAKKWAWDTEKKQIVENCFIDGKTIFPMECNTMPGWAGSSWYFNRYMDSHNETEFASQEALNYWKEVDIYIGGSEHASGHLMYSRFWQKFLYDIGRVPTEEYAKKLVNQGMILGNSALIYRICGTNKYVSHNDKDQYNTEAIHVDINLVNLSDELNIEKLKENYPMFANSKFFMSNGTFKVGRLGEKMSKRWLNAINPDDIYKEFGADTLRMYEMFMGPLEQSKPWNTKGLSGVLSFLKKFWRLYHSSGNFEITNEEPKAEEWKILHKTIKKVSEDIENYSFNTAVSAFMIAVNDLQKFKCNKRLILEPLTVLISPFAPHIAEELWQKIGKMSSISFEKYPVFKNEYVRVGVKKYPVALNGKMKHTLSYPISWSTEQIEQEIAKEPSLKKYLQGKTIKKIIVVPGKIINFVTD